MVNLRRKMVELDRNKANAQHHNYYNNRLNDHWQSFNANIEAKNKKIYDKYSSVDATLEK